MLRGPYGVEAPYGVLLELMRSRVMQEATGEDPALPTSSSTAASRRPARTQPSFRPPGLC